MTYAAPNLSDIPRARSSDPATSHAAADRAPHFAPNHKARILGAIKAVTERGALGANAAEIAHASGLTVVQVDRRLVELQREGRAFVLQYAGGDLERGGYRCWGLA